MAHSAGLRDQRPRGRPRLLDKILLQIAAELKVRPAQVKTAVELLDGGATVPFIARYRKEATDGLDDIQLRELEARLAYLRELEERRAAVLKSIDEQGKLTPELRAAIEAAPTKQELEDLYLPYKPKRRTKGMIAREAGLEPLADKLFADPTLDPLAEAAGLHQRRRPASPTRPRCSTACATCSPSAGPRTPRWWASCANGCGPKALLQSKLVDGKDGHAPRRRQVPRLLRLRRADPHRAQPPRAGGVPRPHAGVAGRQAGARRRGRARQARRWPKAASPATWAGATRSAPADELIRKTVAWTWKVKLSLSLERDLFGRLREEAEAVAIKVFADNLRDLLLAAPAGKRVVMGLDPGIRTGVKVAVVSDTGKVLDTATVYPHEPRSDWEGSLHTLGRLVATHGVNLIAIGNGTASRETDKLAADLIKRIAAARARRQARQGGGQRSRRLGLFGQRIREQGTARPGREPARRGEHRAPPAGPAGRAGEDRPQEHRRRPVPARRQPERAGAAAWTRWSRTASTRWAWT